MAPTYDVVVLGAGAAGTCAAIEVGEAGRATLVLEAAPEVGGAAATSGGGCCLVDTPLQRALGIRDDVDLALGDWLARGGPDADTAWARLYLSRSCSDLYAWCEARGVEWDQVHLHEGNSVPRWHHPAGAGEGLMAALHSYARRLPVDWRTSANAARLIQEADGSIVGVEVESEGRCESVRASAVVVATGGFTNNREMLSRFGPDPGPGSRLLRGGYVHALGGGHDLLSQVGADFTHMDAVYVYPFGTPDDLDPSGDRGFGVLGVPGAIWVNAQGRRFHDESRARSGGSGLLAQTPSTCWCIFDQTDAGSLRFTDPQYMRFGAPLKDRISAFLGRSPYVGRSETIEGLAPLAGLPVAALSETVERYNGWIREGRPADPDTGRSLVNARPIECPPFFSLQLFPLARKNFGGVRTDLSCRVLRAGTVIPGLYAAGEVAGMAGGHINGRAGLEGTMLGPSLFSGRVAGQAIERQHAARLAVGKENASEEGRPRGERG